jgi:hypothetical protein
VLVGISLPTFRDKYCLTPEDGKDILARNCGNKPKTDATEHFRTVKTSKYLSSQNIFYWHKPSPINFSWYAGQKFEVASWNN